MGSATTPGRRAPRAPRVRRGRRPYHSPQSPRQPGPPRGRAVRSSVLPQALSDADHRQAATSAANRGIASVSPASEEVAPAAEPVNRRCAVASCVSRFLPRAASVVGARPNWAFSIARPVSPWLFFKIGDHGVLGSVCRERRPQPRRRGGGSDPGRERAELVRQTQAAVEFADRRAEVGQIGVVASPVDEIRFSSLCARDSRTRVADRTSSASESRRADAKALSSLSNRPRPIPGPASRAALASPKQDRDIEQSTADPRYVELRRDEEEQASPRQPDDREDRRARTSGVVVGVQSSRLDRVEMVRGRKDRARQQSRRPTQVCGSHGKALKIVRARRLDESAVCGQLPRDAVRLPTCRRRIRQPPR